MGNTGRQGAGSDRRLQFASRQLKRPQPTEEEIEAMMDRRIEKAHQRLLERATGGLLTWQGDHIIHRSRGTRDSLTTRQVERPAVFFPALKTTSCVTL